jgi:hypothetical protein
MVGVHRIFVQKGHSGMPGWPDLLSGSSAWVYLGYRSLSIGLAHATILLKVVCFFIEENRLAGLKSMREVFQFLPIVVTHCSHNPWRDTS